MDSEQYKKTEEVGDAFQKKTAELRAAVEAYLRELKIARLKYKLEQSDNAAPANNFEENGR
jgi:hypothetical protein